MKKKALITGITGQDGFYLAEFLLKKGYEVHGIVRRSSSPNTERIDPLIIDKKLFIHDGDVTDSSNIISVVGSIKPDEIYNLAAQSHVAISFMVPEYTANVDALGTLRLLESIRILGLAGHTKYYQASTSELYGCVQETPQRESTPFYPRSPYAVAKLYAYWITVNYREAYNIYAVNGILFNHESPLRGETFVTRKITKAVAAIICKKQDHLTLGNLNAKRDWGYAKDYVEGMWLMMQQTSPVDLILATGTTSTVRAFVEKAFACFNIIIEWKGDGIEEKGYNKETGELLIRVDPKYYRPTEVDILLGDSTKAKTLLNWNPSTTLDEIIKEMVMVDYKNLSVK